MKSPTNIDYLKLNDVIENLVLIDADSTFELIHAQWSEPFVTADHLTYLGDIFDAPSRSFNDICALVA